MSRMLSELEWARQNIALKSRVMRTKTRFLRSHNAAEKAELNSEIIELRYALQQHKINFYDLAGA